jgi:hypothetical protein
LIAVNWSYFYFFVIVRIFRSDLPVLLQIVYNVGSLSFIRSNNPDLFSLYSCSLQIKNYFIDSYSFCSVEIWSSRCWKLLSTIKI